LSLATLLALSVARGNIRSRQHVHLTAVRQGAVPPSPSNFPENQRLL
jgi:hypothetical protein